MEKIKKFLLSKQAKRLYWTTAGGFVALALVYVSGESLWWTPLATAILTGITKEINSYLSRE
jgi:hypothetical protein